MGIKCVLLCADFYVLRVTCSANRATAHSWFYRHTQNLILNLCTFGLKYCRRMLLFPSFFILSIYFLFRTFPFLTSPSLSVPHSPLPLSSISSFLLCYIILLHIAAIPSSTWNSSSSPCWCWWWWSCWHPVPGLPVIQPKHLDTTQPPGCKHTANSHTALWSLSLNIVVACLFFF